MRLRIKEILDEKGISLTILSELTGIEKGNLSAIVNEKKNPTLDTLEKIANGLEVSLRDLFISAGTNELTAFIDYNDRMYKASTLKDLENIIKTIKANK